MNLVLEIKLNTFYIVNNIMIYVLKDIKKGKMTRTLANNVYSVDYLEKVKSILDVMLEMIEVWKFKAVPITVIIGTAF